MQTPGPRTIALKRIVKRVLLAALGAYAALLISVRLLGTQMVFFPEAYPIGDWSTPTRAQDVYFTASDGVKLHGWFSQVPDAERTLVVFHGNAGNIAGRKHIWEELSGMGMNVLMFDYRGFGRSEGSPDEPGVYRDAEAAWRWLVEEKKLDPDKFVLLGQSLGSAVAIELARTKACGKIILEAPLSSAGDMAAKLLPFPPVGWALPFSFDSSSKASQLDVPILVVHGTDDYVVPFEQGKRLFSKFKSKVKSFVEIPGGGHNDLWDLHREKYVAAIQRFLAD